MRNPFGQARSSYIENQMQRTNPELLGQKVYDIYHGNGFVTAIFVTQRSHLMTFLSSDDDN